MRFLQHPATIPVLIALVVLLFGASKLPTLARSLGQSLRIFKSEVNAMQKDDEPREIEGQTSATPAKSGENTTNDRV